VWHIEGVSLVLVDHEDNPLEELLASSLRGTSGFPSTTSKKNPYKTSRFFAQAHPTPIIIASGILNSALKVPWWRNHTLRMSA